MKNSPSSNAPPGASRRSLARAMASAIMAVAIAATFSACSSSPQDNAQAAATTPANVSLTAEQKQKIHLVTVASTKFSKIVEATGAVDFDNDQATSVIAAFSGPVSKILVNPGQKVAKGQPLAEVESSDFAAAIDAYAKALVAARNLRKIADTDKDLAAHDGVAARENQQAEADAASAEADRDAALQALASLDVDPGTIKAIQAGQHIARAEGIIRAPIAGTVAEKLITPGELLQAGTTACFTIADLSRVWVMAQVSSADAASIRPGDSADVTTGVASDHFPGSVDNVSTLVDPNTRAVIARVVVANPGDALKKQMYVTVQIHSQQESNGILVPASAILRDDENLPFVYATDAEGDFARKPVTLGYRTGEQYEISEGLKAGDQIVVDGALFIQFMQNQ